MKKLISFNEYCDTCPESKTCKYLHQEELCEHFQQLQNPTIADICKDRDFDSITEEEWKEISTHIDYSSKEAFILNITQWLSIYEEDLNVIRIMLDKGFKIFGDKK